METITTIDATTFLQAFKYGANEVIKNKNILNKINVFPVNDGDTGNNLVSLMTSIQNITLHHVTMRAVFDQIIDATMRGSRGNSGAIFTQYWIAFIHHMKGVEALSIDKFVKGVNSAIPEAYEAIEKPVEGTMLSVMRAWGEALQQFRNQAKSFNDLFTYAIKNAKLAVDNTTKQLSVLKKHQVVDAGAMGFYIFVEGFTKAINDPSNLDNESNVSLNTLDIVSSNHKPHGFTSAPIYRYCTEVLLTNSTLTKTTIEDRIKHLGDSRVIVSALDKARIHIHTNHPDEVVKQLYADAILQEQKVEDMLFQYNLTQGKLHKIAIVSDSIADLPQTLIDQYQIYILPMILNIDECQYLDKVTIKPANFRQLSKHAKTRPTSSQPSLKAIESLFIQLQMYYEEVIVLTVSAKMSGTYQTLKKMSQKFTTNTFKIHVVDTHKNSAAQGLVVKQVAAFVSEGYPCEEILIKTEDLISKTNILVNIKEFDPMINSGRVPQFLGVFLKQIRLYPLIGLDIQGNGSVCGFAFGYKNSQRKLLRKIKKLHNKNMLDQYAIVHCNNREGAQAFAAKVKNLLQFEASYIMEISPIIAMNAGDGAVAIAYIQNHRR